MVNRGLKYILIFVAFMGMWSCTLPVMRTKEVPASLIPLVKFF